MENLLVLPDRNRRGRGTHANSHPKISSSSCEDFAHSASPRPPPLALSYSLSTSKQLPLQQGEPSLSPKGSLALLVMWSAWVATSIGIGVREKGVNPCDLCGHLQRRQMPDIENSRKTAEKGCQVGHGKTAEKQPENSRKTAVLTVFRVFRLSFRLFYCDPLGTLFGCFRLFSMSGIWRLCRWPQRLQGFYLRAKETYTYGKDSRTSILRELRISGATFLKKSFFLGYFEGARSTRNSREICVRTMF